MMLESFGAILTFAADLEDKARNFYEAAAGNAHCTPVKDLFEQFAKESLKYQKNNLRIRRENVTEMILEPIKDFSSDPFMSKEGLPGSDELVSVISRAIELEENAAGFYSQASVRIKALSEVSRALKSLGEKRASRLEKIHKLQH